MAEEEVGVAVWEGDSPFLPRERQQQGNPLSCRETRRGQRGAGEEEGAGVKLLLETWWVCQPEEEGAGAEEQRWGTPPWEGARP